MRTSYNGITSAFQVENARFESGLSAPNIKATLILVSGFFCIKILMSRYIHVQKRPTNLVIFAEFDARYAPYVKSVS